MLEYPNALPHVVTLLSDWSDLKACDTPPRTPTGNGPYSESDPEVSSPGNGPVAGGGGGNEGAAPVVSQEEDERLAKELSLKEAAAHDLSHRPKRRRFHESYNFNMKCPTPGCNSLGEPPRYFINGFIKSNKIRLARVFQSQVKMSCFYLTRFSFLILGPKSTGSPLCLFCFFL